MSCNHNIIYIGIADNNKEIKIGMTQQTARRRHNNSDFRIIAYYDFPTVPNRDALFELEDELRHRAIGKYGNPIHNSFDYFERPKSETQREIIEWFRRIVRTKGQLCNHFHQWRHTYEEIPREDKEKHRMTLREMIELLEG
jgi:hypothetical protein